MTINTLSKATPAPRLTIALWIVEIGLIFFWGAVVIGIGRFTVETVGPLALWGLGVLIMFMLLGLAGHEINGQWAGILIDTRNKFSLSRLQITLWTVMVLSAYFTMALPRVAAMVGQNATLDQQQALDIRFPNELLLAIGISSVSFAGANLIESNKKSKQVQIDAKLTPEAALTRRNQAKKELEAADVEVSLRVSKENKQKETSDTANKEAEDNPNDAAKKSKALLETTLYRKLVNDKDVAVKDREAKYVALQAAEADLTALNEAQGLLHKNADPSEASWADLFRGEEISNYKLVDMAKVQMLFFTVVVIVTYTAAVSSMLQNMAALRTDAYLEFPASSQSLNALLGISHGTYLSVKTVDK